jgi:hypothetical protein
MARPDKEAATRCRFSALWVRPDGMACGRPGLAWGAASIPAEWLVVLARREDIRALAQRLGSHTIQCYLGHHDQRPPDWVDE